MTTGMKHSTIKKLLRNRIDAWAETINDPVLKAGVKSKVIVSGGAIASGLMGDPINDYDIYFKDRPTARRVAEYYVSGFNSRATATNRPNIVPYRAEVKDMLRLNCKGEEENRIVIYMKSAGVAAEDTTPYEYFESAPEHAQEEFMSSLASEKIATLAPSDDPFDITTNFIQDVRSNASFYGGNPFRPVFLTENAISLTGKIQLIVRFYGAAEEIHKNFDYVHAMCWYDYEIDKLHVPAEAMESMMSKSLIYNGSLYPIASILRMRKFIARGWRITAGQVLKIVFQVSKLNLENHEILRDQLIGVDQAYMHQLLGHISEAKGQRIDSAYIAALIDTIFEAR